MGVSSGVVPRVFPVSDYVRGFFVYKVDLLRKSFVYSERGKNHFRRRSFFPLSGSPLTPWLPSGLPLFDVLKVFEGYGKLFSKKFPERTPKYRNETGAP